MFREIIKNLYIGKSKLPIKCNGREIPQTALLQDVMQPTSFMGRMPDYGVYGNLLDNGEFEITLKFPKHRLFVTGIPKGEVLDNYRIQRTYWSSYYEDDIRGYLFQVTDMTIPRMVI